LSLLLDVEVPPIPPLSDPKQFENVFLRSYSQGQPKIMRQYGDSILRTVTYDVLAELFGKENDSIVNKAIPWAVSNAFYEQIVLHYGLASLRPQLPNEDSRGLTVKRGDLLEAYMAGIVMDVSREAGEGYREIRAWFYKLVRLRLRKVCTGTLAHEMWDRVTNINNASPNDKVSELRQLVFVSLKETMGQVQWRTAIPTMVQLTDFWSRVKIHLDGLYERILPRDDSQTIILLHYRVNLTSVTFSLYSPL
jgi:hypothetical protein